MPKYAGSIHTSYLSSLRKAIRFEADRKFNSGEVRSIEELKGKRVLSLDELKKIVARLEAGK